jgi:hypothetical protein
MSSERFRSRCGVDDDFCIRKPLLDGLDCRIPISNRNKKTTIRLRSLLRPQGGDVPSTHVEVSLTFAPLVLGSVGQEIGSRPKRGKSSATVPAIEPPRPADQDGDGAVSKAQVQGPDRQPHAGLRGTRQQVSSRAITATPPPGSGSGRKGVLDLPRFRGGLRAWDHSGLRAFCSPVWCHSFVRPPAEPFFHPGLREGAAVTRSGGQGRPHWGAARRACP